MKTNATTIWTVLTALVFTMLSSTSFSTTINVTAQNFVFVPANISVNVGDTIRWNRTTGSHTTTCDGSEGSTRPPGAPAWNAPLTSSSPTFRYVVTVAGTYHYICEPHAPDMSGNIIASVPSSITNLNELVDGYELSQNYPNPFNPTTNIKFSIENSSQVSLKIYNSMGSEMETLVNENLTSGAYKIEWNAVNYPSGVYYYKIESANFIQTRKMLLIK